MHNFVLFTILGLGAGDVYAILGLGIVLVYKGSGIVIGVRGSDSRFTGQKEQVLLHLLMVSISM